MTEFFLGIDIGGTKTHSLLATAEGEAVGFGEAGTGNHEAVGYEGMEEVLINTTREALAMAGVKLGEIKGAGFGIAGYDWPSERPSMLESIAKIGLSCPVEAGNDTLVGLLAGAKGAWGVAVDAGTGENCIGRDRSGRIAQLTGSGPMFAEFGGSHSLVVKAIQAISLEWGHRGPATALSHEFVQLAGAKDVSDLLEGLTLGYYEAYGDVAPLVFKVAEEGDTVARECIDWAGRQLGDMVNGIIRQLGFETLDFDVVLIGSMFNGGPMVIEPLRETVLAVAPKARVVRIFAPPVIGGVLLGMEVSGAKFDDTFREHLAQSTLSMLEKTA
jgi:N-acetylglucosamine kinase-like BadF-type ATPase